jgi:hypothetical protein
LLQEIDGLVPGLATGFPIEVPSPVPVAPGAGLVIGLPIGPVIGLPVGLAAGPGVGVAVMALPVGPVVCPGAGTSSKKMAPK